MPRDDEGRCNVLRHENDLISLYLDNDDAEEILEVLASRNCNGMGWLGATSANARVSLIKRLADLTMAMEIPTPRGTVGLVHGEVPIGMDWPTFIEQLEQGDPAAIESCLRGRRRIKANDHRGVHGVGRIFAGHTPQFDGAARFGNCYAIDTGAVFSEISDRTGAAITFANMAFSTASLTAPAFQRAIRVYDQASDEPFGEYAGPRG